MKNLTYAEFLEEVQKDINDLSEKYHGCIYVDYRRNRDAGQDEYITIKIYNPQYVNNNNDEN